MRDDCIFCKIANGEIPSATLYEDEDFRVILDLGPASKGHALILPKEHYKDGPQMVLWNPGKLDDTEKTEIIEKVKKELE